MPSIEVRSESRVAGRDADPLCCRLEARAPDELGVELPHRHEVGWIGQWADAVFQHGERVGQLASRQRVEGRNVDGSVPRTPPL